MTTIQKQLNAYEDYISYCTLSTLELEAEYDPATQRRSFAAWSTGWVYFPVILKGLLTVGRVPRSPCNVDINPIGGES